MAKRKSTSDTPEAASEAPVAAPALAYTVLARRYRPQQFADLVGQEAPAHALMNAITSNRVAHAYLFTGARGVGKTSAARILAKALNCAQGPTTTPCDQCDMCKAIMSGQDMDVLEIDGASNRGIDEIREIRQNVSFRPSRARCKIYIIDEVHMLTTPAFNALLKTLEEPPPHVKFIFATTEVQKIPVTILSRCQRFDFGGISLSRILERLKQVVAGENLHADDDALELVARRAGGSMRDAQSLLDQLLAFGGERLTVEHVNQLLGTAHEDRVAALATAVLQRDAKTALELVSNYVEQGQQVGELIDQLLEYWRDLMIVNCAGLEGQTLSVTSTLREPLAKLARSQKLDAILSGMDILVTAKSRMRVSTHSRVLLEMALVRISQLEDLVPLTQLAQWVSQGGSPPSTGAKPRPALAAPVARPPFAADGSGEIEKKKLSPEQESPPTEPAIELSERSLDSIWKQMLAQVGFAVTAELRKIADLAISGPTALALRVSQRYNTPGNLFQDPIRLGKIEAILARLTGQPLRLAVEWIAEEHAAVLTPSAAVAPPVNAGAAKQQMADIALLPFVKAAKDALAAQVARAEPGFGVTVAPPVSAETDSNDEE